MVGHVLKGGLRWLTSDPIIICRSHKPRSSKEVSAAFTFTSKPLASRCLTQLPQHSQVVDFQTSIAGLATKAGEPNRRAKAKSEQSYLHHKAPPWCARRPPFS